MSLLINLSSCFIVSYPREKTPTAKEESLLQSSLKSRNRGRGFVEHGIAAPVSRARGVAATLGRDGRPVIMIWLMDHRGTTALLVVDATTGRSTSHTSPAGHGDAPYAILLSSHNKFYTLFDNTFLEFDPGRDKFTFVGKGLDGQAMWMTEDQRGIIWACNCANSQLVSYDPATRRLINYGSINKEDWPQYPRSLAVDQAGWIYAGIGNVRGQIAAFNPQTREVRGLANDSERRPGSGEVFLGKNGSVYGTAYENGPWLKLLEGKALPTSKPSVGTAPIKSGSQETIFRDFPDGSVIETIDVPERQATIRTKDGFVRRLAFSYDSEGSYIQSIVLGPNGRIYGSTGHPLRFFAYDPIADRFINRGLGGEMGHWNALAIQRNRIYGALYGGGILFEYDPAKSWNYSAGADSNPMVLARGSPVIDRPHALLAHPDGRHLIMGGTPEYGRTGGGLMIYDLDTGLAEHLSSAELIENQSVLSMEALPDENILCGTTVMPGTGGVTSAKEAELYIFDFLKRKIKWHAVILPGVEAIRDLKLGPDELIYGLATGPIFFVFDPSVMKIVHQEKLTAYGDLAGGQAPRVLLLAPDGGIYAYFTKAIVRFEPKTFKHKLLAVPPISMMAGIALRENRLYFANGSRLWSFGIPEVKAIRK